MFDYLHMMCACAMQSDSDASERAMSSITSRIKAMGYTEACVEQAIAAVGGLDIEPLVLWLLDNEVQEPKEKAISDPNLKSRETTSSTSSSSSDSSSYISSSESSRSDSV